MYGKHVGRRYNPRPAAVVAPASTIAQQLAGLNQAYYSNASTSSSGPAPFTAMVRRTDVMGSSMAIVKHRSKAQILKEVRLNWKARHPHVFVSGIQGQVELETAIAYFHRGHYLYDLNGMAIHHFHFSPLRTRDPFISEVVPPYRFDDFSAVTERTIGALEKTKAVSLRDQQEQDARPEAEEAEKRANEQEQVMKGKHGVRFNSTVSGTQSIGHDMPQGFPFAAPLESFTPHDRSVFLSDSAPGSRLGSQANTPFPTRPPSPEFAPLRRPVASTSRLSSLVADSEPDSPRQRSSWSFGTGRPRRASMALNEHHNANKDKVYGCELHDGGCDGETVAEEHRSARPGAFHLDDPTIRTVDDRVMVDWARLYKEEKKNMGL